MNTTKRVLLFSARALFAAADVPAQDWAKAHLEQSPRHLEWVKVKQAELEVSSFLPSPK